MYTCSNCKNRVDETSEKLIFNPGCSSCGGRKARCPKCGFAMRSENIAGERTQRPKEQPTSKVSIRTISAAQRPTPSRPPKPCSTCGRKKR